MLALPRMSAARRRSAAGTPVATGCLTAGERQLIATILSPTTDAAGRVRYPAQPVGGENLPGG